MSNKLDLVGKTISGIVASPSEREGPNRIWMLQFSDGSHVEFVSPGARRGLKRMARNRKPVPRGNESDPQMALNVA